MKTLFTLALAGTLSFGSPAANASDDLLTKSEVKAKFKTVNVLLKGGIGEAKVALLDQNGKKLHQRTIKVGEKDLVIPYNLDQMPCGSYQVKISTDSEEVVHEVATFDQLNSVKELPLAAFGKLVDDQTINLTVVGLETPGVEVEIRHTGSNKVIYSENIHQPEAFKKSYKLKGVTSEEVYVKVTDSYGRSKELFFE
jgi:hypothetical protein